MRTKKSKNILIVQDFNPLDGVSLSVVTFGLAKELAKGDANITFASPKAEKNTTSLGVVIRKIENSKDLELLVLNSDLVICITNLLASFKPLALTTMNICQDLGRGCIPWIHTTVSNSKFNEVAGTDNFSQSVFLNLIVQAMNKSTCKTIVCVSESVRNSLEQIGVEKEKLTVINNGLEVEKITRINPFGIAKTNDIIFVGRLEPTKNLPLFLNALKLFKESSPEFSCIIVGEGKEESVVKSLIKVFDLENNVRIIPSAINGELLKLIAQSKVLVSTSVTESFGLAIVEAMLVGTLVVAPNIEGPLEVTSQGKFGLLFNQGDTADLCTKMQQAVNMPKENLEKCILAASKNAKKRFNIKTQAKIFKKLL